MNALAWNIPNIVWAATLVLSLMAAESSAQMFGERTLGQPLDRRPSPQNRGQAAQDQETTLFSLQEQPDGPRFLRENRGRFDFVGRDMRQRERFVGRMQGMVNGDLRPAAQDLQPRQVTDANAVQLQGQNGRGTGDVYQPRLAVGFPHPDPIATSATADARLTEMLNETPRLQRRSSLTIHLENRTAILRGEVASAEDRMLAEALVGLEPGVSDVVNELRVRPQPR